MATKWKNRLVFMTAIILFTFGIKGLLAGMSMSSEYLLKDYAQTRQFHSRLNDFISYLNTFELQYVSAEEMKQKITVTAEEIDEHRYRYGDLPEQIDSIKSQYEDKIVAAKQAGLEGVAEIYAAQRDAKIEDITSNFTSDDHVRLRKRTADGGSLSGTGKKETCIRKAEKRFSVLFKRYRYRAGIY